MYDGQMDTADIANEKLKHEMNVWRGARPSSAGTSHTSRHTRTKFLLYTNKQIFNILLW